MEDYFKPRGATKASKPDAGDANIRSVPVFAVVKDNIDPIRSGRLRVYISDFSGTDPNNADSWVTVNYMTPFYGRTNGNPPDSGYGNYKNNPHSYGMWTSPPDIGTTVICIFINGDPNFGFWIGCVPDPDALQMVPAIGSSSKIIANESEANSYGGSTLLPVTNINPNDAAIAETSEFLSANKPVHSYSASVYAQQGLIRDNIRGPLTTSAQRESPSRVGFGVSTPGRPIYEGGFTDDTIVDNLDIKTPEKLKVVGRRGGHTFIMDDGDLVGNDRLVRIRTTLGHQILLSDSGQCLHIIHANGQSWIELGKEGTIDMYSTNSVNVRTQGDLNLHADNNINLHAVKDLSIQAENIKINSEKNTQMKVGADFIGYAMGKYTWKVDGSMSMLSGGEGSYASGGVMFINGTKVNLNTGKASVVPATVPPLATFAHTDTLYDSVKGFAAAPGKLISITSRAPAHAPWANAGQGVNVQTKLSAEDNLPKPAASSVEAVNASASAATPPTPTVTTISTVPVTTSVSKAIDTNTTSGILSVQALAAATGPAVQATKTGVAVDKTSETPVAVGVFGMTPKQMETGGYLKPGTAEKIEANIRANMPPDKAFDPSFFTNKDGVSSLASFVNKMTAQTTAQTANLQKAQTQLQSSGVMTGQESPSQVSGMIVASVQAGTSQVINAIKTVSGNIVGDLSNKLNSAKNALGVGSKITNAIASGNLAASITGKVTSGLSSVATSLTGLKNITGIAGILESTKSISENAFKAVTASFKPFKAFSPVNLIDEAKKNAEAVEGVPAGGVDKLANLANKVPGVALQQLGNAASRASGISNLPGGQQAVDAVVKGTGTMAAQATATVANISASAKQLSTAVTNGVSVGSIAGAATGITNNLVGNLAQNALKGLPPALASQIQGAISSISSGGTVNIKLPLVAEGTTDRAGIESATTSLLGDPGIPPPNYSGNVNREESEAKIASVRENLTAQIQKLTDETIDAKRQLELADNNYPAGSAEIDKAKQNYLNKKTELANLQNKVINSVRV